MCRTRTMMMDLFCFANKTPPLQQLTRGYEPIIKAFAPMHVPGLSSFNLDLNGSSRLLKSPTVDYLPPWSFTDKYDYRTKSEPEVQCVIISWYFHQRVTYTMSKHRSWTALFHWRVTCTMFERWSGSQGNGHLYFKYPRLISSSLGVFIEESRVRYPNAYLEVF